ncbi:DUF881 domain-containing protein [Bacillus fonticola]|uniref:DUF881 domain-containing protein n=1 Tax=Bacillus fonticola TaxID=2728853 RepID=UPI0014736C5E|nr:DUF881 domain-containing protein [Bacillus fonticola]
MKKRWSIFIIAGCVGFLLALQLQAVNEPAAKDTDNRDNWELRQVLITEKELQSDLIKQIRESETTLTQYDVQRERTQEEALRETLEELKKAAGFTEIVGPGITITLDRLSDELLFGDEFVGISPGLLKRLVNELNRYQAKHIAIEGQRLVNTSVIRDINGETKVDGKSLYRYPMEIQVVTETMEDAERLYNRLVSSRMTDEFFIDDLLLEVGRPDSRVTLPAYGAPIRIRYMEAVEEDEGGA